jgi:hypothetical protein
LDLSLTKGIIRLRGKKNGIRKARKKPKDYSRVAGSDIICYKPRLTLNVQNNETTVTGVSSRLDGSSRSQTGDNRIVGPD